jgi:hypothetical protein
MAHNLAKYASQSGAASCAFNGETGTLGLDVDVARLLARLHMVTFSAINKCQRRVHRRNHR